jgi:2-dehydro-3-deoxygluconokinase
LSVDVISIGEPMIEFTAREKGNLRKARLFELGWGGDTSNFAVAVARLGKKPGYICRVGDDEFGMSFLEMWKREGVDSSHVIVEKNGFTAAYFISLKNRGEHDFTYIRKGSAASHLSPQDIDSNYIKSAKLVHISGITQAISENCRAATSEALSLAKESGVKVSYDPNFRLKLWPSSEAAKRVIAETVPSTDIFLPTAEEATMLTGTSDPVEQAEKLLNSVSDVVAIKMGAKGCYMARSNGEKRMVRGFRVKVVDTTGAGDAFDGAVVVGCLEDWPIRKIGEFANGAGALKTTGRGAVKPLPTRRQVERLTSRLGSGR